MKTTQKRTGRASDPRIPLRDRQERIARLYLDAVEMTLPAKAEQTLRQWFSRHKLDLDRVDDVKAAALAMALAMELESFTPSHTGTTAVDRLARQRQLGPEDRTAVQALKDARFAPYVVRSPVGDDLYDAEDLATKRNFTLFDAHLPPAAIGMPLIARLCALDAETSGTVGLVTPLDGPALAVALDFVRPGRGIPHGHRCAAAVYRHIVRHGGPLIAGLNDFSGLEDDLEDDDLVPSALDSVAAKLVWDGILHDPTPEVLNAVRRLVSADTIMEALYKAVRTSSADQPKIAATYRRFAEVMIEALHRRALAGSGLDRSPLDRLAGMMEAEVTASGFPRAAVDLFGDIRRALAAYRPRQNGEDLTRVIERIRALRAKTVDQGCTEEEALAAADKVAELLDRYGLSLGETDLRQQACLGVGIESTRKRMGPLDDCVPAIAYFCDCRAWNERTPDGTIRSMFFGLPADVEAAQYLFERVATALDTETAAFRKGEIYQGLAGGGRQKATTSFQLGLGRGIGAKLDARKADRDAKIFQTSGRDLVPVKQSVVEDELAKLGMSFTTKDVNRGRLVLLDAYEAGQVASGRFEIQSELERA